MGFPENCFSLLKSSSNKRLGRRAKDASVRLRVEECEARLAPASIAWNNSGTDWAAGVNWVGGTAPADNTTSDLASFNSANYLFSPTLGAARSVAGITVGSSSGVLSIGGSALTLGGSGITVANGATASTIATPLVVGATQTWTNNSPYPLTISGTVDDQTGGRPLTISGSGNILFSGKITTGNNFAINSSGTTTLAGGFDSNQNTTTVINFNGGGVTNITSLLTGGIVSNNSLAFTVGDLSANNTVNVKNGGKVTSLNTGNNSANTIIVGGGSFGNNTLNFTTPGTNFTPTATYALVGNGAHLDIGTGSNTGSNSVSISNSAWVGVTSSPGGTSTWNIGNAAGNNNNSLFVKGTGSVASKSGGGGAVINLGGNGSAGNSVVVSAGGVLQPRRVQAGGNGSNNTYTITGINSTMFSNDGGNGVIEIGVAAGSANNGVTVANGGVWFYAGTSTSRDYSVGSNATANNNFIAVTGVGSTGTFNIPLALGIGGLSTGSSVSNGGVGNHLDVFAGGSVAITAPVALAGTNSALNLGNGVGISTLTTGTSAQGTNVFANAGSSGATVNFNSGRLIANANGNLISGPGTVVLNGTAYISTTQTGSVISSPISGGGSLVKEGSGTLTIQAADTATGATIVNAGVLVVATASGGSLSSSSTLTMGGGTFQLTGTSSQTVNGLTLTTKASTVTNNSTGALNLGAIAANPTGTVNFSGTGAITTSTPNANDILGGYATFGGSNWAANDGSGNIVAYSGYTNVATGGVVASAAGANVQINDAGGGTVAPAATGVTDVNSLLVGANVVGAEAYTPGAADTLRFGAQGGILALGSGGLNVGGTAGNGNLTAGGANDTAGTLYLTNNSSAALVVNSNIVNNGVGVVGVVVSGTGTTQFTGANTFSGPTYVANGTLSVGVNPGAFANSNVTVNGAGAILAVTAAESANGVILDGGATINGGGALTSATTFDVRNGTVSTPLAGSAGLTKTTEETVTLGVAATYTGTTTVSAGTLTVNGLASASSVVVNGGTAVLNVNGATSVNGVSLQGNGNISGSATLTSATNVDAQSGWIGVALGGVAGLSKTTAGVVTLTGNNTYLGATSVTQGTLIDQGWENVVGGNPNYGSEVGSIPDASAVTVNGPTAVLDLGYSDTVASVVLDGNGTISNVTSPGSALTSVTTFDVRSGTASAVLGGANGLTKTTSGTVVLGGDNTYTGTTTVSAGTLAESATGYLADASALTVNGATATFDLGANHNDTVSTVTLDGGGSITGSGSSALTSLGTFQLASGCVTAVLAGAVGLNKNSSGTVTLAGANTYAGVTTVNLGKLTVASTGAINSTSGVTISGGEFNYASSTALSPAVTFSGSGGTLSGTGTITQPVTVTSGNTIAPGNSSIGTLTVTGAVALSGNASFEINATASTSDKLVTAGALAYGGTLKVANLAGTLAAGQSWTLFAFGSQSLTFANDSSFNGVPNYSGTDLPSLAGSGLKYVFNYSTGVLNILSAAVTPTVTSVTPFIGPTTGGNTVVIIGTGFLSVTAVNFGVVAASYSVDSISQITATAPAGTATVDVTVTNTAGTSNTAGAGDDYTYTTPAVTSVVVNGALQLTLGGATWTAGNPSVTVTSTSGLAAGYLLSSLGAGFPANATVASVTSGTTFTLTVAPTISQATATTIQATNAPQKSGTILQLANATWTNGSTTVTVASTANLFAGQYLSSTGTGLPANASVSSVVDGTTFELSAPATADQLTPATIEVANGAIARDGYGNIAQIAGQNSVVEHLLVTFNMPVRLDVNSDGSSQAFSITSLASSVTALGITPAASDVTVTVVGVTGAGNNADGYTQYVLNFIAGSSVNSVAANGAGNAFSTLNSGFFQLNSFGSKIHSGLGDTAAARSPDPFWALYGAVNPKDIKVTGALGGGNDTLLVDGLALNEMYSTFASSANRPTDPPIYETPFDWNLDGNVDGIDLSHLYSNFGTIWRF